MKSSIVGRRYAAALIDLAEQHRATEKIGRDLSDLVASWEESAELREVFDNPSVNQAQRRAIVEALSRRMAFTPVLINTLLMLADRRRMRFLPEIAGSFHELAEERSGQIRAEVTTAAAMPESYFIELQKALCDVTGKTVILDKKQDPSLIAGVITRVGDKVFDGSVRNHLQELKEELLSR